MKKTITLFFFALLCAMCANTANAHHLNTTSDTTYTVTIGSDREAATYWNFPFSSVSLGAAQKTQMIYPEEILGQLPQCQIKKMTFFLYSAASMEISTEFHISLAVVPETQFEENTTTFLSPEFTEVYVGPLSINGNEMEVSFTTPFIYEGGNLLLQFDMPIPSTAFQMPYFWHFYPIAGSYDYDYFDLGYWGTYYEHYITLPLVTIEYELLPDGCARPSGLQLTQTLTETTISWDDNEAISTWEVEWGEAGFAHGAGTSDMVTTNAFTINETLQENAAYDVYVRAHCNDSMATNWTKTVFTAPKSPIQTPFVIDFEDDAENALWELANFSSAEKNGWYIGEAANNGGNNGLYISQDNGLTNSYDSNEVTVYAYRDIYFTPNTNHRLSFDWRCNGQIGYGFFQVLIQSPKADTASGGLWGYITEGALRNPERNTLSFFNNGEAWQRSYFNLPNNYNGTVQRLYFVWTNVNTIAVQPPAAIDNIVVETSDCPFAEVTNCRPYSPDSVRIIISGEEMADQYEMAFDTADFNPETASPLYSATSNHLLLTGLQAETTYHIYVRAICGEERGAWSAPYIFTTPRNILTVPFTIDFEDADVNAGFGIANNDNPDFPNGWYIGEAEAFESEHGLYVSADSGVTAGYESENATCLVYAYQDVYFSLAENYTVSADIKIGGEISSSSDIGSDAIFFSIGDPQPTQAEYENDNLIMMNYNYTIAEENNLFNYNFYDSWMRIVDYESLVWDANQNDYVPNMSWRRFEYTIPSEDLARYAGKTKRLYFGWFNDDSYKQVFVAAIDNISITAEGIVDEPVPEVPTISTDPIDPIDPIGISDATAETNIQLFPNPTADVLHIKAEGFQQYELFNFVGQKVGEGNLNGSTARISTANLTPGIYFVRLDERTTRKFVKK